MRRRHKPSEGGWFFISGGTHRRSRVFKVREHCGIFLENLHFYRKKYGYDVMGYALLPDHYHLLLALPPEVALLPVLRDFKSAIGRQIVDSLKSRGEEAWLRRLQIARPPQRWKDSRFKVLQADNDVVRIRSEKFFHQKLDYIHANPVRHGLVERAIDYPYSSLRWYSEEGSEERAQWQGPLG
ncbi:MAG: REP-associated tyrosine transposase [Candidatus Acidiferrales bacterium]